MRGRCPSCSRTLGLSSGLFSLWSSSSLSLPASSVKTRESVDSEASQKQFFFLKHLKSAQNSFARLEPTSRAVGCSSTYNMHTFLPFLPVFLLIFRCEYWFSLCSGGSRPPAITLTFKFPFQLECALQLLLELRRFSSLQSPELRLNTGLVCEEVPVFEPGSLWDNGNQIPVCHFMSYRSQYDKHSLNWCFLSFFNFFSFGCALWWHKCDTSVSLQEMCPHLTPVCFISLSHGL